MNYDMKHSGERIHQLLIKNGLTQEKTANALNIDQSYYGRIETGKKAVLWICLYSFPHCSMCPGLFDLGQMPGCPAQNSRYSTTEIRRRRID